MRDPFAKPPALPAPDPNVAILAALDQLRAAISNQPPAPQVVVEAPPVDLTEIVTAVNGLKPGATADEIADAVKRALTPAEPVSDETAASLADVAAALKKLEFRLQGVGTQAYGGGAVSLDRSSLTALAALSADPTVTAVVTAVTNSGDTTVYTPTSGKAVRLRWIYALTDPDETTNPLITVKLGTTPIYGAYALAHRQTFTGAVGDALVVNLSDAASVAVTAHIEEV